MVGVMSKPPKRFSAVQLKQDGIAKQEVDSFNAYSGSQSCMCQAGSTAAFRLRTNDNDETAIASAPRGHSRVSLVQSTWNRQRGRE